MPISDIFNLYGREVFVFYNQGLTIQDYPTGKVLFSTEGII